MLISLLSELILCKISGNDFEGFYDPSDQTHFLDFFGNCSKFSFFYDLGGFDIISFCPSDWIKVKIDMTIFFIAIIIENI